MLMLLLHLFGDYVIQSDMMARYKSHSDPRIAWKWVSIHAITYGLPFLFIGSWQAVLVIIITHMIIDRYSLAKYVIYAKNRLWDKTLTFKTCQPFGYRENMPIHIAFWLYVIVDNTLHLTINYLAIQYL